MRTKKSQKAFGSKNEKYILTSNAAGKALNEMADNGTLSEEEEIWNELYETRNDFPNYGIICNQPIYTSNDVTVGGGSSDEWPERILPYTQTAVC